jgi:hypothetical protein
VTGKSRILMVLAVMMAAVMADGSAATNTNSNKTSFDIQNSNNIPDAAQIKSDLVGNFMYVSGGLPGFWAISSPEVIRFGNIRSTRRDGDRLEFNFTAILVDDKTEQGGLYRAETLVTYQQVDGNWKFLKVKGSSINKVESDGSAFAIDSDTGC